MNLAPTTQGVADDQQFAADGFQIFPKVISSAECDRLAVDLTELFELQQHDTSKKIGGVRNLFRLCPSVAELAASPKINALLKSVTGGEIFPVRAIFFDKTPGANWRVPWHQDLTIAVNQRIETPGFAGWSIKDEILHVQPPVEILADMVTLRLHLDDCDTANGALKVLPRSHLQGRLTAAEISSWVDSRLPVVCEIARGGAMVMRPLLLHASSPSVTPSHRRVLHIEYAAGELPNGLKWFDS